MNNKSKAVSRRRNKIKQMALIYKGSKCCLCGYDKSVRALEFHHVIPENKSFGISKAGYQKSWLAIKAELDKCILVCANCHAEIHDNLHNTEMLLHNMSKHYEESLEAFLLTEKSLSVCPQCGKPFKKNGRVYCSNECHSLKRTKSNKPTKNELESLIHSESFLAIGRMFNVSDNTIRKWCKGYDLPYRKKDLS